MKILLKVLKYLLLFLLAIALFCTPILITVSLGETAFTGLLISISILSVILLFILLRVLWARWREKKFINGLLKKDNKDTKDKEDQVDGALSEEISQRWKDAVSDLKKSNLKNHGNPLYVLPWYMLIGESASGKTTSIKNSGLTSKYASPEKTSGISGTKNCDWWFFEQAIIIDTAGRYAIHQDDTSDEEEWRFFLSSLGKYRKKEPLNGLIITVPADKLLNSSPDELEDEGKKIRIRIEELMQSLGARFPVYVLVTKCDLIYGMKQFFELLPQETHKQAFGYVNKDNVNDAIKIVEKTFVSVNKILCQLRLRLSNQPGNETMPNEVLLFPEEFARLQSGFKTFVDSAFNKSIYQEQPYFRGIYFSSATQSGETYSHFIESTDFDIQTDNSKSDNSFFLFDFFTKVLPSDRYRFSLTQRALQWKKKIKLIKHSAWITAMIALCGFLSWSFAVNLSTIKKFQQAYSKPPVLQGEFITDINTLDSFKQVILSIEKQNKQSWFPNFGLNHCEKIEKELKKRYCDFIKNDFLISYDKKMTELIIGYSNLTPVGVLAKTVPHYVRRINLLAKSLKTDEKAVLEKAYWPDFKILIASRKQNTIPKAFELLNHQYMCYLLWADNDLKAKEMERLKKRLEFLVIEKKLDMKWLVTWYNSEPQSQSLTHKDFWFNKENLKGSAVINPSYTLEGLKQIKIMIGELEKALITPLMIGEAKSRFYQWYEESYINEWSLFCKNFNQGAKSLYSKNEKLTVTKMIAAGKGPYFTLLKRVTQELEPFNNTAKKLPEWIKLSYKFSSIQKYAVAAASAKKNKGVVKRMARSGLSVFGRVGRSAARVNVSDSDNSMIQGEAYLKYKKSLQEIAKATISPISSYNLASIVFSEDPAVGNAPVHVAKRGLEDLKSSLECYGAPKEKIFVTLLNGPLDYVWGYVCEKAGCHIQNLWDEKVLAKVAGIQNRRVKTELLFDKSNGCVTKFQSEDIGALISRSSKRGYYAKTIAGKNIPFTRSFFKFLGRGALSTQTEKAEYKVRLTGVPTDVNPNASILPHETKLEVQCAETTQILENYNFPATRTFKWSPQNCGDVTLTIYVGNLALKKEYTGYRPFAQFLRDFYKGEHHFPRHSFREKAAALKRLKIEYINVKYEISGAGPVVHLLRSSSGNAPRTIVKCSD